MPPVMLAIDFVPAASCRRKLRRLQRGGGDAAGAAG